MALLAVALAGLAWLGRQGARAVAALVVVGIAAPPLGHLLRPYLTGAVFALLLLSFLRVDAAALRVHLRRPGLILAATLWTALGVPAIVHGLAGLAELPRAAPGLFVGVTLQSLASPLMAGPALAALMGLDATLVLITLVTGTLVVPATAPVLAQIMLGGALVVPPLALGLRLGLILAGSLLLARLLRGVIGTARIERHRDVVSGLNILALLVFVSAVMGDLAATAWADPAAFVGLAALAFGVFAALLLGTALLFRRAGRITALSLGIMASQRNMGLIFAATDGAVPGTAWLYFALCQFPIYLSPLLLPPILRMVRVGAGPVVSSPE